ncbi:hypothetical protein FB567DRAFT_339791 [Paraphoma chrysanthemicola]|uniref:Uncharacterized protein n=1 Tax=Paraphoma chrysanthemicola TaxID=798071 RepID=A0A8K0R637_9PLEO|nr:hypothetical protein FB567DRAFT_339791 [Paraphoma chrysanthemicola]
MNSFRPPYSPGQPQLSHLSLMLPIGVCWSGILSSTPEIVPHYNVYTNLTVETKLSQNLQSTKQPIQLTSITSSTNFQEHFSTLNPEHHRLNSGIHPLKSTFQFQSMFVHIPPPPGISRPSSSLQSGPSAAPCRSHPVPKPPA